LLGADNDTSQINDAPCSTDGCARAARARACFETNVIGFVEDNEGNDVNFEETMTTYHQKKFNVVPQNQCPITDSFVKSLEFTSVADRLNLSTRDMTVIAGSLGRVNNDNFEEMTLSWSTIRRIRLANRKKLTKVIEDDFVVQPDQVYTVHWDGKTMENTTYDKNEDNNK